MFSDFYAISVIVWICISLFAVTGLITIGALVGWVTLGGNKGKNHDYYLRRLFAALIIEIVAASVAAYGAFLNNPTQYTPKALGDLDARFRQLEAQVHAIESPGAVPQAKGWQLVRIDDCPGTDDANVGPTSGATPKPDRCKATNITAVCWDGELYQNGGSPWCTYKRINPSSCSGGGRPGRLYRCDPS